MFKHFVFYPGIAVIVFYVLYKIYAFLYFNGAKFNQIKESISENTKSCNALNGHIEDLKSSYSSFEKDDYGQAAIRDNSVYNMSRTKWYEEVNDERTIQCTAVVCKNAKAKPFAYLCKYFNIEVSQENLQMFEQVFNDFSAAEDGKRLLARERDSIVESKKQQIPWIVQIWDKEKIVKKLGFEDIDFTPAYVPTYSFQYVSPGGNSASRVDIRLDVDNLQRLIAYFSDLLDFRNTVAGQRALMTPALREKIKQRDGYACRYCKAAVAEEKNLLLEIDHIMPLSKGGTTCEENLQTLCWRCNRSKGAKYFFDAA